MSFSRFSLAKMEEELKATPPASSPPASRFKRTISKKPIVANPVVEAPIVPPVAPPSPMAFGSVEEALEMCGLAGLSPIKELSPEPGKEEVPTESSPACKKRLVEEERELVHKKPRTEEAAAEETDEEKAERARRALEIREAELTDRQKTEKARAEAAVLRKERIEQKKKEAEDKRWSAMIAQRRLEVEERKRKREEEERRREELSKKRMEGERKTEEDLAQASVRLKEELLAAASERHSSEFIAPLAGGEPGEIPPSREELRKKVTWDSAERSKFFERKRTASEIPPAVEVPIPSDPSLTLESLKALRDSDVKQNETLYLRQRSEIGNLRMRLGELEWKDARSERIIEDLRAKVQRLEGLVASSSRQPRQPAQIPPGQETERVNFLVTEVQRALAHINSYVVEIHDLNARVDQRRQ